MKNTLIRISMVTVLAVSMTAVPTASQASTSFKAVSTPVATPIATPVATPSATMGFQIQTPSNIVRAFGLARNRVGVVVRGASQTLKFTAFDNGSGTPAVALTPNKNNIVVLKADGKQVRSFNVKTGNSVSTHSVRTSLQNAKNTKVFKMHNKDIVIVATRKGRTLSTTSLVISGNGTMALKNTKTKTVRSSTGSLAIGRSGNRAIITSGRDVVKYNVLQSGNLSR